MPRFAVLIVAALAGLGSAAQARPMLYVGNSTGSDVSVIDLAKQQGRRHDHAGPYGAWRLRPGRWTAGLRHHRIRPHAQGDRHRHQQGTDTIALPGQPNECAATADGRYVLVPILGPVNVIAIVDTADKKVVKTLPHPPSPQLLRPGRRQQQRDLVRGAGRISHQPHRPQDAGPSPTGAGRRAIRGPSSSPRTKRRSTPR